MDTYVRACQHNICKDCLLTYSWKICVQSESVCVETFLCPLCRQKCKFGKIGEQITEYKVFKRFPENRLINELLEGRKSLKNMGDEDTGETQYSEIKRYPNTTHDWFVHIWC